MRKRAMRKILNQMIPREYWWINKILIRLVEVAGEEVIRAIFLKIKLRSRKEKC